jgi:hypothetical protein
MCKSGHIVGRRLLSVANRRACQSVPARRSRGRGRHPEDIQCDRLSPAARFWPPPETPNCCQPNQAINPTIVPPLKTASIPPAVSALSGQPMTAHHWKSVQPVVHAPSRPRERFKRGQAQRRGAGVGE